MNYHLFEVAGIELEYMLVNSESLNVLPLADELIFSQVKEYVSEIEMGEISWSNELVLHVIELKTNGPKKFQNYQEFQKNIFRINEILKKFNGKLLPSGMHPFMNPFTEAQIWHHEYNEVYEAYNKIFNCKGHGWSNVHSAHINLPFANDDEFAKLHAAIRLLLPIIPAVAASSPIIDGNFSGFKDMRMEVYRHNQEKIPSVAGKIIPEKIFSKNEYEEKILKKIYSDIAQYDSNKILQNEWLNSRGAIPRFDRNTIEIRVIDAQECPKADIAIASLIIETLKMVIDEKWGSLEKQMEWDENRLHEIFLKTIKDAEDAVIDDEEYLLCFGIKEKCTAGKLWQQIFTEIKADYQDALKIILTEGTLATRILKAINNNYSHNNILKVYGKLAECLEKGEMFNPS